MEISVELKDNSRYLVVKDEQITNKLAINMAMQCKSLLPPIQQENKVIYNLEQLISINEYLSGEVSRDKGFTIIKKLLQEFMNLSEYLLSDADIILQTDSVFWDSNTEKIYFVPASEILNYNSISKFNFLISPTALSKSQLLSPIPINALNNTKKALLI